MKQTFKTLIHTIETLMVAGIIVVSANPIIIALSIMPMLYTSSKLVDDINGNKINNSIFSVSKKGKITQNSLAHPFKMLSIAKDKNKSKRFSEEALEMFTQLNKQNKKNEDITYTTKSQSMTLMLLKQLQSKGFIQNLNYKETKKSRLLFEKLFMGNLKDIKKKNKMYNISFNLTDVPRDKANILETFNKKEESKASNEETLERKKINKLKEIRKYFTSLDDYNKQRNEMDLENIHQIDEKNITQRHI